MRFLEQQGDHEGAKYPNWPVAHGPMNFQKFLKWQWEEKLIPYWKEMGQFAQDHQVKIGLELHGGFLVHTPYTLLKLREATCDAIGANLDPSHLWWQGIDPVGAIKILAKENAIHHFHAKDTYIDQDHVNMYGLTDMQPYDEVRTEHGLSAPLVVGTACMNGPISLVPCAHMAMTMS